jgi:hypothetical protein
MIINDRDISGAVVGPIKANAVLLIDPYAVLSFAVARQGFKSIARWYPHFFQTLNRV